MGQSVKINDRKSPRLRRPMRNKHNLRIAIVIPAHSLAECRMNIISSCSSDIALARYETLRTLLNDGTGDPRQQVLYSKSRAPLRSEEPAISATSAPKGVCRKTASAAATKKEQLPHTAMVAQLVEKQRQLRYQSESSPGN